MYHIIHLPKPWKSPTFFEWSIEFLQQTVPIKIVLYMYATLTLIVTHLFVFAAKSARCWLSRWRVQLRYTINTRFGLVHMCTYAILLPSTRTYFILRQNVKMCSCTENKHKTLHTDKNKKKTNKYLWKHTSGRRPKTVITDDVERKVNYVNLEVSQFIRRK
jgi:hypothetical protein